MKKSILKLAVLLLYLPSFAFTDKSEVTVPGSGNSTEILDPDGDTYYSKTSIDDGICGIEKKDYEVPPNGCIDFQIAGNDLIKIVLKAKM